MKNKHIIGGHINQAAIIRRHVAAGRAEEMTRCLQVCENSAGKVGKVLDVSSSSLRRDKHRTLSKPNVGGGFTDIRALNV